MLNVLKFFNKKMKRLILITFLFISISASAINYMPKHAIGMTAMPDYGFGINYTGYVNNHYGVYTVYAHSIKQFTRTRFAGSQKVSTGVIYLIYDRATRFPAFVQAGACYNTYRDMIPFYAQNKKVIQRWSYEAGAGVMLSHAVIGIRIDLVKHDVSVDLKWNFGRKIIRN